MAIYPGAVFKPTPYGGLVPRNRQGRGMLHVAVSDAKSLPPTSGTTWHLYIAKAAPDGSTDGSGGPAYCEQYVDTDFRAYGGADGNDDQLIVETAGGRGTSAQLNAEKWTRAQELRIADFMRWEASQPGGAPLELLPDARPGRRGWGPHRLGVKHSGGPRPGWWQPGSELWSNSLGKECPGDAKVAQIPAIIELAREDDMPSAEEIAAAIVNRPIDGMTPLWQVLRNLHSRDPQVNPVAQAVVDRPVAGSKRLWEVLRDENLEKPADAEKLVEQIRPLLTEAAVAAVLQAQGADATATADEIAAKVVDGIAARLATTGA